MGILITILTVAATAIVLSLTIPGCVKGSAQAVEEAYVGMGGTTVALFLAVTALAGAFMTWMIYKG